MCFLALENLWLRTGYQCSNRPDSLYAIGRLSGGDAEIRGE